MAHSSDYSHIWAEITDPLTIDEIAAALGVGDDNVKALCESDKISKFAKFKPTRAGGSAGSSDWWKSNDGMCGLEISYQEEDLTVLPLSGNIRLTPEWGYLHPRGESVGEWYRILDFDGYTNFAVTEGNTPVGYFDNSSRLVFGEYDTPVFNVRINGNNGNTLLLHSSDISPRIEGRELGDLTTWYVGLFAKPQGDPQGVFLKNYSGQERLLSYYQGVGGSNAQFYNPEGWGASALHGKTWTFTPVLYKYFRDGNHAVIGFGTPSKQVQVFQYSQSVTYQFLSMSRGYSVGYGGWYLDYNFLIENYTRTSKSIPVRILVSGDYDNRVLFEDRNTNEVTLSTAELASFATKTYNSWFNETTAPRLSDSYPYIAAIIQIYITTPWGTGWSNVSDEIWLKGQPPIQ